MFGKADEGASILYSGGTTGTTKGILLSNMNFNALGLQTIAASGFSPIDGLKMLSVMPVFHGFGLGIGIHTALIGGACCILVPKFNVNTYAELLIKSSPISSPASRRCLRRCCAQKSLKTQTSAASRACFRR